MDGCIHVWVLDQWGIPGATSVKEPACQCRQLKEMWVWSLGRKGPLEEDVATLSSILVWRIPWTEETGGPQSIGSQRVGHDWNNLACTHIGSMNAWKKKFQKTLINNLFSLLGRKNAYYSKLICWHKVFLFHLTKIIIKPDKYEMSPTHFLSRK